MEIMKADLITEIHKEKEEEIKHNKIIIHSDTKWYNIIIKISYKPYIKNVTEHF